MKVLLIKTSSMGDVIHTLPALTDAKAMIKDISFDWVVEDSFKEIPRWHSAVDRVLPVNLRYWIRNPVKTLTNDLWRSFRQDLKEQHYDLVIDVQGLVKSAFITRMVKAPRHGLGIGSAREWLATFLYNHRYDVSWEHHAVSRVRKLFAQIFNYQEPSSLPNYGIDLSALPLFSCEEEYMVLLHGTTWETKHWPSNNWVELAKCMTDEGYKVLIPWGNDTEKLRAEKIASVAPLKINVLPKSNISQLAAIFANAAAIVAVDTGLGHLACALHRPTVSVYGPTSAKLTGTFGPGQIHISADFNCSPCFLKQCKLNKHLDKAPPCYDTVTANQVWHAVKNSILEQVPA